MSCCPPGLGRGLTSKPLAPIPVTRSQMSCQPVASFPHTLNGAAFGISPPPPLFRWEVKVVELIASSTPWIVPHRTAWPSPSPRDWTCLRRHHQGVAAVLQPQPATRLRQKPCSFAGRLRQRSLHRRLERGLVESCTCQSVW